MILIDTSSWIHLLRPDGDLEIRGRVEDALRSGEAGWFLIVQLELWNGARGGHEQRVLRRFAEVVPVLPMDEEVWSSAYRPCASCSFQRRDRSRDGRSNRSLCPAPRCGVGIGRHGF